MHVSLHDWDDASSTPSQEQCQTCRISQLAAADLSAPAGDLALAALHSPDATAPAQRGGELFLRPWMARAPPLHRSSI